MPCWNLERRKARTIRSSGETLNHGTLLILWYGVVLQRREGHRLSGSAPTRVQATLAQWRVFCSAHRLTQTHASQPHEGLQPVMTAPLEEPLFGIGGSGRGDQLDSSSACEFLEVPLQPRPTANGTLPWRLTHAPLGLTCHSTELHSHTFLPARHMAADPRPGLRYCTFVNALSSFHASIRPAAHAQGQIRHRSECHGPPPLPRHRIEEAVARNMPHRFA